MWLPHKKQIGLFCCLLATACGFQPVHAERTTQSSVSLSAIEVAPIEGRNGQILQITLEDTLDPQSSGDKRYLLEASIEIEAVPVIIEPDGTASRYRVLIRSPYTLKKIDDGSVVETNSLTRTNYYNISDVDYSSYIGAQDAVKRGIEAIAHDYALVLAARLTDTP